MVQNGFPNPRIGSLLTASSHRASNEPSGRVTERQPVNDTTRGSIGHTKSSVQLFEQSTPHKTPSGEGPRRSSETTKQKRQEAASGCRTEREQDNNCRVLEPLRQEQEEEKEPQRELRSPETRKVWRGRNHLVVVVQVVSCAVAFTTAPAVTDRVSAMQDLSPAGVVLKRFFSTTRKERDGTSVLFQRSDYPGESAVVEQGSFLAAWSARLLSASTLQTCRRFSGIASCTNSHFTSNYQTLPHKVLRLCCYLTQRRLLQAPVSTEPTV